jgi:hypothetical protein
VGYVDLRKRRRELSMKQEATMSLRGEEEVHVLTAISVSLICSLVGFFLLPLPVGTAFAVVTILVAMVYVFYSQLSSREPGDRESAPGAEKQLLMAIQDADGSITPIEAALRTSLSVDEAEALLSRFADRGHLFVEGRDGVLSYVLPGSERGRNT